ncbi:MAG: thiamine-phosphate pyrophosphorylase [Campylobacterota bacterium]
MIDANVNRCKEGLRVVEDVCRFVLDDKALAQTLKSLRHNVTPKEYTAFLTHRNIIGDVGKESTPQEQHRANLHTIITSNLKRAQESARVLEETFKLVDVEAAQEYKHLRYSLYDIELRLKE